MLKQKQDALEQKYRDYVHGEVVKLRYKLMLVFTAWSVTLLFVYGAQQLMNGSVLFIADNQASDLKLLPYIVSGLVALTVMMTLLIVREYRQVVKTIDAISQGNFPSVEDKPPFTLFGVVMIFVPVLALMLYVCILAQYMWSNWFLNSFALFSVLLATLAALLGYNAGVGAYTLLRKHKRDMA